MFSSLSVLSAIATPCSIHDNVLSAAGDEGGGGFDAELRYLEDVSKGKPLDWISGSPVANEHGRFQIIKNDDLEELQELGDGTSGTVYHGKWRGSDVAIEIINDKCFAGKPSEQEEMNDFWNEASNLVDLHQPNVLAFYGVVLGGPGGSIATVTEYMCQTLISGGVRGTLPRMATELLNGSSSLVTEKVDVFFFGIVLWELLTGEEPYADLHYGVIIAYLLPFVEINDNEEQVLATEACSTGTHEPIYLSR